MTMNHEDKQALSKLRIKVKQHYTSLDEALRGLARLYDDQMIDVPLLDWQTNRQIGTGRLPRYLFRGEPGVYHSSTSSRARIKEIFKSKSWNSERKKLTNLYLYCAAALTRLLVQPDPHEVVGFLQHYGLPTATIDLTSALDVAAYFSSFGAAGRVKLIGVFPVEKLFANRRRLADLRGGRLGERPDKQQAFVLFQLASDDYKSAQTCDLLGIEWYSVDMTDDDRVRFNEGKAYLSEANDPFMGLLPLFLREFERDHGKFHPEIRAMNLDKIPDIPLVINQNGEVVLQPESGQSLFRITNSNVLAGLLRPGLPHA